MQYVACGRGDPTPSHCLQCSGVQVKWVKHMVHLGVVLTPQNSAQDEVNKRTAGAAQTHRQPMVLPVLFYSMHLVPLRKSDHAASG